MFDLKRPCINCPFRRGQGQFFGMRPACLQEIKEASAFQCHKTFDHEPQQCAGLMAILRRDGAENQIMQVAERLGAVDFSNLDPRREAYATWADALAAHGGGHGR